MREVLVIGAGSIGNHMAHAGRSLDCNVSLSDIDTIALERTMTTTYPERYGAWDSSIGVFIAGNEPKKAYDLIVIGVPPNVRSDVLARVLSEFETRAILLEKPICSPAPEDLSRMKRLCSSARQSGISLYVGYDHSISQLVEFLKANWISKLGAVSSIEVLYRESWQGILKAHPWLDSVSQSYLGSTVLGGGALCEHSHGVHLLLEFARVCNAGDVARIACASRISEERGCFYDEASHLLVSFNKGIEAILAQDVVTLPKSKRFRLIGELGIIEGEFDPSVDSASLVMRDGSVEKKSFEKTRPEDFRVELEHVFSSLGSSESPISYESGLKVMDVIVEALGMDSKLMDSGLC